MSGHDVPAEAKGYVTPRAIMLAQEINRQCDQLLAIISKTLVDFATHRADTEAQQVRDQSE